MEWAGNLEVKDSFCVFVVYSLDQLRNVIIPHFEKYPLGGFYTI